MLKYSQDQIITAAHFYYLEGFTQEEVARRLNVSRVAVTRMLKRAREEDLVHVTVKKPLPHLYKLSLDIEKRFNLKMVSIVPTNTSVDETLAGLGKAGADLLASLISPGCRIGAAWSKTAHSMLPYMRRITKSSDCMVNELAGTYLTPDVPYSVSLQMAERLMIPLESIPVPVLVKSEKVKRVMLQEEMIQKALKHAEAVDFAFVGLGDISENSSLSRTGYITGELMDEIERNGAVGDILMRFYDNNGQYIRMSFESRTISLQWEKIKKIPLIIAMAFGSNKVKAIQGALRGKIIHGLITDRSTAEQLLLEEGALPS
jgi:DNA-binding transcriptional regulator LsrR (DeoR family)